MDFLLDDTGDLHIEDGDISIGKSESQEIEMLLIDFKGEWKEHPIVGGGLAHLLKHRKGQTSVIKEAKIQLAGDGFNINDIEINEHNIRVDAER